MYVCVYIYIYIDTYNIRYTLNRAEYIAHRVTFIKVAYFVPRVTRQCVVSRHADFLSVRGTRMLLACLYLSSSTSADTGAVLLTAVKTSIYLKYASKGI